VLVCDTGKIKTGDRIRVDLMQGFVENVTRKERTPFESLPPIMVRLLEDGGLIAHVAKNGGFAF
jgi:3-isopropylmalate/(R)-2-methylmalate dehydratase small subunit